MFKAEIIQIKSNVDRKKVMEKEAKTNAVGYRPYAEPAEETLRSKDDISAT